MIRFNSNSLEGTKVEMIDLETGEVLETFPSLTKTGKFFNLGKSSKLMKLFSKSNAVEITFKNKLRKVYLKEKV